jgi:hypothetical protein
VIYITNVWNDCDGFISKGTLLSASSNIEETCIFIYEGFEPFLVTSSDTFMQRHNFFLYFLSILWSLFNCSGLREVLNSLALSLS